MIYRKEVVMSSGGMHIVDTRVLRVYKVDPCFTVLHGSCCCFFFFFFVFFFFFFFKQKTAYEISA